MTSKEKTALEKTEEAVAKKIAEQKVHDCRTCKNNEGKGEGDSIYCKILKTWSCEHAPSCGGDMYDKSERQVLAAREAAKKAGRANLDRLEEEGDAE